VTYQVLRCHEGGVTLDEFQEIFAVGLVVGSSIVIPHLMRAMVRLEELGAKAEEAERAGRARKAEEAE